MFKSFLVMLTIVLLAGCAGSHPKPLLGKEGDTYNKSPCAACRDKPFYVNGHWLR